MKLHKNQSGIAPVLILLIIILLGGAGFATYRVQQANQKARQADGKESIEKQSKAEPKKEEYKIPEGFVEYENKELKFNFAYPKDWKRIENKAGDHVLAGQVITSPDYENLEEGYGGTTDGTKITVQVFDLSKYSKPQNSKILDGSYTVKSRFTDIKKFTANGLEGVQYKSQYEGPALLITQWQIDGKEYNFMLEEDINGPVFNENNDKYDAMIASFKKL